MQMPDLTRLIALAAIWGASFIFMRIASPEIGAVNTAFLRVFFGFVGLALILIAFRNKFDFKGKIRATLALGIINSGIPFFMYCMAARTLPAGYSAILNATTPLMGAFIGFAFFNEKMTPKRWIGAVLGLIGIVFITTTGGWHDTGDVLVGVAACLIATSCYGLAGYLTRRWITNKGGLDPKLVAFGSQIGATVFLMPFFIGSVIENPDIDWFQGKIWLSVICVGFLCTSVAYIIYFKLIETIGALRTLTVTFLIPIFAVIWGYLALSETINEKFIIGSVIVCAAVWLVVSPEKTPAKKILKV
ncbi:membrane protein [Pseudomonas luteola]|uniref:Membrane protein n=1 Tax=Pseudomonas luteola TaxID=47886 RepID=A0A2X2CBM1_PSELU|nr:EamA family transporter [Pseudomonas luteola]MCG7374142.1 DMT family transporter [Pseudomonas luteola]SPZ04868.1 membrane protein [Pseudomonas luteola]